MNEMKFCLGLEVEDGGTPVAAGPVDQALIGTIAGTQPAGYYRFNYKLPALLHMSIIIEADVSVLKMV